MILGYAVISKHAELWATEADAEKASRYTDETICAVVPVADLAAAKAQGAADERAAILGLLADEATVEAIRTRQRETSHSWVDAPLVKKTLDTLRELIAERAP